MHYPARIVALLALAVLVLGASPVRATGTAVAPTWSYLAYDGAGTSATGGQPAIPSYGVSFPPGWTAQHWPDTLAGYGQIQLWPTAGAAVDLVLLPLRRHGPTAATLEAHDAAFLISAKQDRLKLPLGTALRLSGLARSTGQPAQFLYLQRRNVLYRFFSSRPTGTAADDVVRQIAAGLQVPAVPGKPSTKPPASSPSSVSSCCHCPAWGNGWGAILTHLDGIPVYSNAGNINNGCTGTYGILYQCVELAQRYFALRWGYPAIWQGVAGAADMRAHHPAGITFVANGGSPGPRKGDALVFYGGIFGHVALVKSVDQHAGHIDVVEENWSPSGETQLSLYAGNTVGIRDSASGSYVIAGWLHSTRNGTTTPTAPGS